MHFFQIGISTLLFMSASNVLANEKRAFHNQKIVEIEDIDFQLNSCRQFVKRVGHENINVLNQFDTFAKTLKNAFLSGEGLIYKDVNRIIDAIVFSADKHQFQIRKDFDHTPYIIHPIGVANHLMAVGNVRDPDIIIGALLHDTVEDTETTFEEIEERFGNRVANFIQEVTDDKSLPKETRKQFQIEHAPEKSAGAAQIKLADKFYNLRDMNNCPPVDWELERVDAYFKWAQAVVDNLPWVNAELKTAVDEVIHSYWSKKQ